VERVGHAGGEKGGKGSVKLTLDELATATFANEGTHPERFVRAVKHEVDDWSDCDSGGERSQSGEKKGQ